MKSGRQVRFYAMLISVLAATVFIGVLVYQTTYDTLRESYQQFLDRNVDQGVLLVEDYLQSQTRMLALYASVAEVQRGHFGDLPRWLTAPTAGGTYPQRLSVFDARGRGTATGGQHFDAADRPYFQLAQDGKANVAGPMVSRIDQTAVIVVAYPIPGNHPEATVLSATIELETFSTLLNSVRVLSGASFTLADPSGTVIASSGPPSSDEGGRLKAVRTLSTVPWTLSGEVNVDDLMRPVQKVLLMVGILAVTGVCLILVFFFTGLRHRQDLDQAREDRTQALRDAYEQIRKLAYHDTVTRLPNRNLTTRRIAEALQSQVPRQVLVVAIARFRNLTTTFGLRFGDLVLKETAARLTRFAGNERNFIGRLGGSEFLLMMDETDCGPRVMDDLLKLFDEPVGRDDLRLRVNVHVGACRLLEAGATAEEVIKSAETALWAAREKGTSEASELTEAAVQQRQRRADLQKLLPEALARGEFAVHYQPQVSLKDGSILGYEGLLRWTNPQLGPVNPSEFIPVAEETGAIVPLGSWVLDQGIEFARTLQAAGRPAVVSVNVSAVQFLQLGFLDELTDRIGASGLDPRLLGIEITESTLLEGILHLRTALERVMAAGVKVSLDDFGTGYSSLNYLKDLPLHVLKIDKTFIDDLDTDDRALHLIQCIIDLAHHLGLTVLAEGVETDTQHRRLSAVGCDVVQGYFTGRPRPADAHLEQVPV